VTKYAALVDFTFACILNLPWAFIHIFQYSLRRYGGKVVIRDKSGKTPWDYVHEMSAGNRELNKMMKEAFDREEKERVQVSAFVLREERPMLRKRLEHMKVSYLQSYVFCWLFAERHSNETPKQAPTLKRHVGAKQLWIQLTRVSWEYEWLINPNFCKKKRWCS